MKSLQTVDFLNKSSHFSSRKINKTKKVDEKKENPPEGETRGGESGEYGFNKYAKQNGYLIK